MFNPKNHNPDMRKTNFSKKVINRSYCEQTKAFKTIAEPTVLTDVEVFGPQGKARERKKNSAVTCDVEVYEPWEFFAKNNSNNPTVFPDVEVYEPQGKFINEIATVTCDVEVHGPRELYGNVSKSNLSVLPDAEANAKETYHDTITVSIAATYERAPGAAPSVASDAVEKYEEEKRIRMDLATASVAEAHDIAPRDASSVAPDVEAKAGKGTEAGIDLTHARPATEACKNAPWRPPSVAPDVEDNGKATGHDSLAFSKDEAKESQEEPRQQSANTSIVAPGVVKQVKRIKKHSDTAPENCATFALYLPEAHNWNTRKESIITREKTRLAASQATRKKKHKKRRMTIRPRRNKTGPEPNTKSTTIKPKPKHKKPKATAISKSEALGRSTLKPAPSKVEKISTSALDIIAESNKISANVSSGEAESNFAPSATSSPKLDNNKRQNSNSPGELLKGIQEEEEGSGVQTQTPTTRQCERHKNCTGAHKKGKFVESQIVPSTQDNENPKPKSPATEISTANRSVMGQNGADNDTINKRFDEVQQWFTKVNDDVKNVYTKMDEQNTQLNDKMQQIMSYFSSMGPSPNSVTPVASAAFKPTYARMVRGGSLEQINGAEIFRSSEGRNGSRQSQWRNSANRLRSRSATSLTRRRQTAEEAEIERGWAGMQYAIAPLNYPGRNGDVITDGNCRFLLAFLREIIKAEKANEGREEQQQFPDLTDKVSNIEFKHGIATLWIDEKDGEVKEASERLHNAITKANWDEIGLPALKLFKANELVFKDVYNTSTKASKPSFEAIKRKLSKSHPNADTASWKLIKTTERKLPSNSYDSAEATAVTSFTFTADHTLRTYIKDKSIVFVYDEYDKGCGRSTIRLSYAGTKGILVSKEANYRGKIANAFIFSTQSTKTQTKQPVIPNREAHLETSRKRKLKIWLSAPYCKMMGSEPNSTYLGLTENSWNKICIIALTCQCITDPSAVNVIEIISIRNKIIRRPLWSFKMNKTSHYHMDRFLDTWHDATTKHTKGKSNSKGRNMIGTFYSHNGNTSNATYDLYQVLMNLNSATCSRPLRKPHECPVYLSNKNAKAKLIKTKSKATKAKKWKVIITQKAPIRIQANSHPLHSSTDLSENEILKRIDQMEIDSINVESPIESDAIPNQTPMVTDDTLNQDIDSDVLSIELSNDETHNATPSENPCNTSGRDDNPKRLVMAEKIIARRKKKLLKRLAKINKQIELKKNGEQSQPAQHPVKPQEKPMAEAKSELPPGNAASTSSKKAGNTADCVAPISNGALTQTRTTLGSAITQQHTGRFFSKPGNTNMARRTAGSGGLNPNSEATTKQAHPPQSWAVNPQRSDSDPSKLGNPRTTRKLNGKDVSHSDRSAPQGRSPPKHNTVKPRDKKNIKHTIGLEEYRNRSKFNPKVDRKGYAISKTRTISGKEQTISIETPATAVRSTEMRSAKSFPEYKVAKKRQIFLDSVGKNGSQIDLRVESTSEFISRVLEDGQVNINNQIHASNMQPGTSRQTMDSDATPVFDYRGKPWPASVGQETIQETNRDPRDEPPCRGATPRSAKDRIRNRDGESAQVLPWGKYYLIHSNYPYQSITNAEADRVAEKMESHFKKVITEMNTGRYSNYSLVPQYFKGTKLRDGLITTLFTQKPTTNACFIGRSMFEAALQDLIRLESHSNFPFPELHMEHENDLSRRVIEYRSATLKTPTANASLNQIKESTGGIIKSNRNQEFSIRDWHQIEEISCTTGTLLRILVDGRTCEKLKLNGEKLQFRHGTFQIRDSEVSLEGKDPTREEKNSKTNLTDDFLSQVKSKRKSDKKNVPRLLWRDFNARSKLIAAAMEGLNRIKTKRRIKEDKVEPLRHRHKINLIPEIRLNVRQNRLSVKKTKEINKKHCNSNELRTNDFIHLHASCHLQHEDNLLQNKEKHSTNLAPDGSYGATGKSDSPENDCPFQNEKSSFQQEENLLRDSTSEMRNCGNVKARHTHEVHAFQLEKKSPLQLSPLLLPGLSNCTTESHGQNEISYRDRNQDCHRASLNSVGSEKPRVPPDRNASP